MSMIEVRNLTKKFGEFVAVRNISFNIERGTIVGFVGKNGAGKTTTIRCILDFLKPTAGIITVNGYKAADESDKIKSFTGYMPADCNLYENVRCRDVFKLSCDISGVSMDKAESLCRYFELDITKPIKSLSLGNKKKVSVIQALLKETEVLILDEPTSGLDLLMQIKFFEMLLKLKEKGMTIFLSSHNLNEIQKYCDRVLIIKDGEIAEDLNMDIIVPSSKHFVSYKTQDGKEENFESDEDINALIKSLAKLDLEYLEIKHATVEDEFIKYYRE